MQIIGETVNPPICTNDSCNQLRKLYYGKTWTIAELQDFVAFSTEQPRARGIDRHSAISELPKLS